MPDNADQHSDQAARSSSDETAARLIAELREVNEQLLLAGLREQALKDQLRDQLTITQAITDTLSEGVCALDARGQITFANPTAAALLGTAAATLRGRRFRDVVYADAAGESRLCAVVQSGTTVRNDDDTFRRRDGSPLPVAYSAAPIMTGQQVTGMVVTFRDNTERKRLEAVQAEQFAHEQHARTAAETGMRTRTEALELVSHDLRTPLTVIQGRVQLALRNATHQAITDHRAVDNLGKIDAAIQRMGALIDELMDTAQLAAGQPLTLQRHPTDLVALTHQVVAGQTSVTRHRVVVSSSAEALVGDWDAVRLERVLVNLLTNAAKYSADGRRIWLQLESDTAARDWVVVTVHDEGIGIPARDLPHVFERFFRASNADHSIAGRGVGLAGAKAIVEQHGGTIGIASVEGSSTTVTLRLPCSGSAGTK